MSQTSDLIEMLKQGWVTPYDALRCISSLRFSARIDNVKRAIAGQDLELVEQWVRIGRKRVKQFRLKKVTQT